MTNTEKIYSIAVQRGLKKLKKFKEMFSNDPLYKNPKK